MTTSVVPWLAKSPGVPRPHSGSCAPPTRACGRGCRSPARRERRAYGVVDEHPNVRLQPAVREHDDRVARREREELVGERRARVHERDARLSDPLAEQLPVRREVRRRSDAAPHDASARGEHRDGVVKRVGRTLRVERFERRRDGCRIAAAKSSSRRRLLEGPAQPLAERRVVARGRPAPGAAPRAPRSRAPWRCARPSRHSCRAARRARRPRATSRRARDRAAASATRRSAGASSRARAGDPRRERVRSICYRLQPCS